MLSNDERRGRRNAYKRQYYALHKEKHREYNRRYYLKNRGTLVPRFREYYRQNKEARRPQRIEAGRRYYWNHRDSILQASRQWHRANGPMTKERKRDYYLRLRMEALGKYGGVPPQCACCGEAELEFLSIDHLYGGGGKHRRQIGAGGNGLVLWLRKNGYPSGFQVLCHNCNLAKGYYGECPHTKAASDA
jgi:hypothetical protein